MGHINIAHLVKQSTYAAPVTRRRRKPKKVKGVPPSKKNELWYKANLLAIVKLMEQAVAEDVYPTLQISAPSSNFAGDALPMPVDDGLKNAARRFGGIRNTADRLARLAAKKNQEYVDAALAESLKKSVGIDIAGFLSSPAAAGINAAMETAISANVDLITSVSEDYFTKVAQVIEDNLSQGLRWESIVENLTQVGSVTESRAKLIARDQTNKMNGAFNKERQTEVGISQYTWRTAGDERVREEHAAHEGEIFDWDDAPADTGHPGEDINCRCVAEPYFNLEEDEDA